jgi:hypothetical protein
MSQQRPLPPSVPPSVPASVPAFAPTYPTVQRVPPRRRRRVAPIIACVLAVLVGGAGGIAVGHRMGAQPVGPTTTPTVMADFPDATQRHLRGVTVSALAVDWLADSWSWTCEDSDTGTTPASGASTLMGCTPRGDTAHDLRVNIEYDGENRVRAVHGLCVYGPGDQTCKKLFSELAGVLLERDDRLRETAVEWAGVNVDNDDSTVIGDIRLIVNLSPHYLRGVPAG